MKKQLMLLLAALPLLQLPAQIAPYSTDFSWVSSSSSTDTSALDDALTCGDWQVDFKLITSSPHHRNWNGSSPLSNGHPAGSVLIPYPLQGVPLTTTVTITLDPPQSNIALLVRDLDEEPTAGTEETLENFRVNGMPMMPTSVVAVQGSFSVTGNSVIPTSNASNGWFTWVNSSISSIQFDYLRVANTYAILLDSLRLDCNLPQSITDLPASWRLAPNPCDGRIRLLADATPFTSAEVTDVHGRVVALPTVTELQAGWDTGTLPQGVFFLALQAGEQRYLRRFVVMH